ncbi:MAG: protease modulator HflC [Alphaproteobacteria bacterium]|nr:protease modulator HflC [Alphaproteobacteria bacterium]
MNRGILSGFGIAAVASIIAYSSIFTVSETEQVLLLQLGEPIRVVKEPGINFKLPLIQNVITMEKRILNFDPPSAEVIAADKKRLVVDVYARYSIDDPLRFYQAVGTEAAVRSRLSDVINSSLRKVLGRVDLSTVLSAERSELMRTISEDVNTEGTKLGVRIVDVRIKRADLPDANSQAVFRRMQAEREREAREARARGAEEAQKVRADADRQRTVLLAEARKQSEILRGEGDGLRNRIYVDAFQKDPEFFTFYRSMQAYRTAMSGQDTTLVLSPTGDFFRYFGSAAGADGR